MKTWLLLLLAATSAAAAGPVWHADEPRFYGYVLGDLITRRITLDLPTPDRLLEGSLPTPARVGRYFELRRVDRAAVPTADGTRYRLDLTYQVIGVADQIRIVDLPAFSLKYAAGGREHAIAIAGEPLSLGPVAPANAFDDWLPDVPAQTIDPAPARRQTLAGIGAAALLAALGAAWRYLLPWLRPSRRPFHRAWRRLRRLRPHDERDLAAALQAIHAAFNQTFGATLMPEAVPAFVAAHPAFAGLEVDIADFFGRSHRHVFGGEPFTGDGHGWRELIAFCRRLRRAERRR